MELSPSWEANRFLVIQENPRILCKPNINSAFTSVRHLSLSWATSIQSITHNIILSSTPTSYKWSLSLRFPHQNPVYASPLPYIRYMPSLSHSFEFITRTILSEQYRSLSPLLRNFLHSPVTSSLSSTPNSQTISAHNLITAIVNVPMVN